MTEAPIIVVGAGMAGLACAVELCRRGKAVTVLEAAPAIGGRTRSFIYRGVELDNGQHLMLSCYDQTHKLRNIVQADTGALYRQPFIWSIYSPPCPHPRHNQRQRSRYGAGAITIKGGAGDAHCHWRQRARHGSGAITIEGGAGGAHCHRWQWARRSAG